MCVIIDTNVFSDFLNPKKNYMDVVRKWIDDDGKLAYSTAEKFKKELTSGMRSYIDALRFTGRLKLADTDTSEVQKKLKKLKNKIVSDDVHILALAIVSGAKRLVTEDEKLIIDFKNKEIVTDGKIYKKSMTLKNQRNLFINYHCP